MTVPSCCARALLLAWLGLSSNLSWAADGSSTSSLSLGYRVDSLDWNISGKNNSAGSKPNIVSELEWRDLDILQFKAEIVSTNYAGIVFRGNAGYGWVLDGVNQDSDYAGSNRTLEFSRSINDVDGSRVLDLSGGLGFRFYLGEREQLQIIPMVGYSYHNQDLRMSNGNQVVWSSTNAVILDPALGGTQPLGPFPGLDSSYDAEWAGPWLGSDFVWSLQNGGTLFARLEAHWVDYFAQANWNLRPDFAHPVSFEHEANGRGQVLELGWHSAAANPYWAWGVSAVLQSWTTGSGIYRVYGVGGDVSESTLNEANWSSRSINITLQKGF